jgi:hypothetical protein
MDKKSLFDILNSLRTREEKHADLTAEVVPLLVEWLGFRLRDIRFEHAFVYGPSARVRVVDALVLDSETGTPALLFEVKQRAHPQLMDQGRFLLKEALPISGAFAGILISPDSIDAIGQEVDQHVALGTTSWEEAEGLRNAIAEAHRHWRRNLPSTGRPAARDRTDSNRSDCDALLDAVRTAATNDEKKKTLERLVRVVFERLSYLQVKYTDLRTASSEIDLIVENRGCAQHTLFDEFGRHFLVECKNWASPVGAKEVRDFVGKLLKTKQRLGVLATREGVTGADSGADALREIQFCFDALNTAVLVLTEADLIVLCAGAELHDLLDKKLDRLRFDLP